MAWRSTNPYTRLWGTTGYVGVAWRRGEYRPRWMRRTTRGYGHQIGGCGPGDGRVFPSQGLRGIDFPYFMASDVGLARGDSESISAWRPPMASGALASGPTGITFWVSIFLWGNLHIARTPTLKKMRAHTSSAQNHTPLFRNDDKVTVQAARLLFQTDHLARLPWV